MDKVRAFVAVTRFGYGARLGELTRIADAPEDWLRGQTVRRPPDSEFLAGLPTGPQLITEWLGARTMAAQTEFNGRRGAALFRREIAARTRLAAEGSAPFRERLVRFWSNHFTVSAAGKPLRPFVGAFEREAIRPHVAGKFSDMLRAVVRHPAMLIYLDNINSTGPNSRHGKRHGRGLNENLAREILELHTLGVNGGYTQADVIAFARILTGWRYADLSHDTPGGFAFEPGTHEPGSKTLLGKVYEEKGVAEGEAALMDLSRHPSTARFVATKLARHFVADDPPASAIERLRRTFLDTDGDLGELARTLVGMPESWAQPFAKVKTPDDLTVSIWRLVAANVADKDLVAPLEHLGQEPFTAPSPAGWPDIADSWIGPESMMRRIELAEMIGRRYWRGPDAVWLAEDALGPVVSDATTRLIRRSRNRQEGLTLLIASREFQRR